MAQGTKKPTTGPKEIALTKLQVLTEEKGLPVIKPIVDKGTYHIRIMAVSNRALGMELTDESGKPMGILAGSDKLPITLRSEDTLNLQLPEGMSIKSIAMPTKNDHAKVLTGVDVWTLAVKSLKDAPLIENVGVMTTVSPAKVIVSNKIVALDGTSLIAKNPKVDGKPVAEPNDTFTLSAVDPVKDAKYGVTRATLNPNNRHLMVDVKGTGGFQLASVAGSGKVEVQRGDSTTIGTLAKKVDGQDIPAKNIELIFNQNKEKPVKGAAPGKPDPVKPPAGKPDPVKPPAESAVLTTAQRAELLEVLSEQAIVDLRKHLGPKPKKQNDIVITNPTFHKEASDDTKIFADLRTSLRGEKVPLKNVVDELKKLRLAEHPGGKAYPGWHDKAKKLKNDLEKKMQQLGLTPGGPQKNPPEEEASLSRPADVMTLVRPEDFPNYVGVDAAIPTGSLLAGTGRRTPPGPGKEGMGA